MGRIVSNFFISLDGVVESPDQWHFPYFDDAMGQAVDAGLQSTGALLMGRVLYEEWAAFWPESDEEPIASMFNEMPKYVVSRTLTEATWTNSTIVAGDVATRLREIRDATEGDLTMAGSATLVRWLLTNRLLDRLNLMVHPLIVGSGQRLFESMPACPLELVSHETFGTGVIHASYAPTGAGGR